MIEHFFVEGSWPQPQEEIGKAVDLTGQAVGLILKELPKSEELSKEMLERYDVPTGASRGPIRPSFDVVPPVEREADTVHKDADSDCSANKVCGGRSE